jgi:hypothetical protein
VDETPFSLILVDLFDDTSPLALTPTHVLQPGGEPIPIGLLTTQPRSKEEVQAAGYAFVVPMPFDLATFLAQIATALNRSRAEARRRARSGVHSLIAAADPPPAIATDPMIMTAADVRAQAAELRTWARDCVAWVRNVQASAWDVRVRAAAARRDARVAREQAGAVRAEAQEAIIRAQEVRILAKAAGERAGEALMRAS